MTVFESYDSTFVATLKQKMGTTHKTSVMLSIAQSCVFVGIRLYLEISAIHYRKKINMVRVKATSYLHLSNNNNQCFYFFVFMTYTYYAVNQCLYGWLFVIDVFRHGQSQNIRFVCLTNIVASGRPVSSLYAHRANINGRSYLNVSVCMYIQN